MKIHNKQGFWAGVMFAVLGAGFAWKSLDYQLGTALRLGPGYFSFYISIVLALLGAIILIESFSQNSHERRLMVFNWRTLVFGGVLAGGYAVIAFALILPGLVGRDTFMTLYSLPPEFFSREVFFLTCIAVLASGALPRSVAMVLLGILLGLVGTDVNSGAVRFTFGIDYLQDGIDYFSLGAGALGIGLWAKLPKSRLRTVFIVLWVIAVIALQWLSIDFATGSETFFIPATLVFGIAGYVWTKLNCESAPLFLGCLSGPALEENFRRALLLSKGEFSVFFTYTWSASFLALAALVLILRVLLPIYKRKHKPDISRTFQ